MSETHAKVIIRLAGAEVPTVLEFSDVRVDFVGNFIRLYRLSAAAYRDVVAVFGSGQLISLVVA